MTNRPRILITGASGFLGSWVTQALLAAGEQPRLLARPHSDLRFLGPAREGVEIVQGDLLDPASLRAALEGVEQLYHLAGWITFHPRDAVAVQRINYEGTINLFEAALAVGVGKVVYPASIFALGSAPSATAPAMEAARFNAPDLLNIPYVAAKRAAELASEHFIARGLPLVRLVPGLCLGPGDRTLSSSGMIAAWLRGQVPAIVGGGGICLVDVRDAAQALIAAMRLGTPGVRYLATGCNSTIPGLFEQLAPLAGRRAPRLRLPVGLVAAAGALMERLMATPPVYSATARLMGRYWWYDDSWSRAALGLTYRPFEETLRDTIQWLRGSGGSR